MADLSILRENIKSTIDKLDERTLQKILLVLEEDEYLLAESNNEDLLLNLSPEQEASLLRGIKDAEEGRVTPHNEIMLKYNKWLTR